MFFISFILRKVFVQRIAWVSPIARDRLLRSAGLSHALLNVLPESYDVEVFADDHDLAVLEGESKDQVGDSGLGFPLYHYHRIHERNAWKGFDCFVYQLEDHEACSFVARSASIRPGICYFHDLNLNRLYQSYFRHSSAETDLNDLMDENFGPDSARLGNYHVRHWSIEAFDRVYACGEKEIRAAALAVLMNDAARNHIQVKEFAPSCCLSRYPVDVIEEGKVAEENMKQRRRLGISSNDLVVGFSGSYVLADRMQATLEAFLELQKVLSARPIEQAGRLRLLWIAGDEDECKRAAQVMHRVKEQGGELGDVVHIVQAHSGEDYLGLLCVPNVFAAVRFDALRALPRGLIESLARGVPAVVAKHGPSAELPSGVVIRIPVGSGERQALALSLEEILRNPGLQKTLAQNGRDFVAMECAPPGVLADLEAILGYKRAHLRESMKEGAERYGQAQAALLTDLRKDLGAREFTVEEGKGVDIWGQVSEKAVSDFGWGKKEFDR